MLSQFEVSHDVLWELNYCYVIV